MRRLLKLASSAGAAVLAVTALGAAPAGATSARAAQTWSATNGISVLSHGNGHGHGMSQYGAEGAARRGLGYGEILRFYYPGTRFGTSGGAVRVLITGDTSRDVVVGARSGLPVTSLGNGRSWRLTTPAAKRWRILPAAGGASAVSYLTRAWHAWRTIPGDAQFAAGGKPVTLYTPGGTTAYRGTLRSATSGAGTDRDTVNVVPLDGYLRGVVPEEVPALWHAAAVRAQAVAARTYAAHERAAAPAGRYYQTCDTDHCQVYGGYSSEHPASNAAVAATAGRILTSGGRPAFAQFSASNGGWTTAGGFSYLPAKSDPYDGWSGNPFGAASTPQRRTISDEMIEAQWPGIGSLVSITVTA